MGRYTWDELPDPNLQEWNALQELIDEAVRYDERIDALVYETGFSLEKDVVELRSDLKLRIKEAKTARRCAQSSYSTLMVNLYDKTPYMDRFERSWQTWQDNCANETRLLSATLDEARRILGKLDNEEGGVDVDDQYQEV